MDDEWRAYLEESRVRLERVRSELGTRATSALMNDWAVYGDTWETTEVIKSRFSDHTV